MKKIISIATILTVAAMVAGPGVSNAATAAELQAQINALLAQLQTLQAQLAAMGGGTGTVPAACAGITSFVNNLTVGSTGNDVKCLQALLNQSPDTQVAASGPGSPGNETTYFGPMTRAAVAKYQAKKGISPAAGYFGPMTRASMNQMLAAGVPGTPGTPGMTCASPTEGSYTVTLSPSPAGGTVSTNTAVPVYGIDIKAVGSDIVIGRLDLQMALTSGGSTLNPSTFVTKVAIYDGETLVKEKPITSNDVIMDSSNNYYVRIIDFNFRVPKDTTKTLTVKVDTTTSYDVPRQLTVNVYSNGIRGRDCANIDTYAALATSRTYTFNVPGQGTLTASVSTDNPVSNNIQISATDGVQNVPLITFNLKSTVGDTILTRLSVNVATGTSSAVPTIIKLYDGDTLVASADPSSGVGTFENFRLTVPKDTTKKMTIKADFGSLTVSGNNVVTANIPTTGNTSVYERANGSIGQTVVTTAIAANPQYLYEQGVKITFLPEKSSATVSTTQNQAQATGVLKFKVEPFGGIMTKPTYATGVSGATNQITVLAYTATGAVYSTGASRTVVTTPDQNIPEGSSSEITVTMVVTNDGSTGPGQIMFKVEEFYWEVGSVIAQQGYDTGNMTDNWKTPYVNLPGS